MSLEERRVSTGLVAYGYQERHSLPVPLGLVCEKHVKESGGLHLPQQPLSPPQQFATAFCS